MASRVSHDFVDSTRNFKQRRVDDFGFRDYNTPSVSRSRSEREIVDIEMCREIQNRRAQRQTHRERLRVAQVLVRLILGVALFAFSLGDLNTDGTCFVPLKITPQCAPLTSPSQ